MSALLDRLRQRAFRWLTKPSRRYSKRALATRSLRAYLPTEYERQATWDLAMLYQTGGDYLEFGVADGQSFLHSMHYVDFLIDAYDSRLSPLLTWIPSIEPFRAMRFFAFDSFEGLPAPGQHDQLRSGHGLQTGDFRCSQGGFTKRLRANGADLAKVVTVPGWFDATLHPGTKTAHRLERAAFAYIDCDLYESARQALDFLTDLLVTGSIVMFDDWWLHMGDRRRGVQRAFHEWLERNPTLSAVELIRMQTVSFVIQREAAAGTPTYGGKEAR